MKEISLPYRRSQRTIGFYVKVYLIALTDWQISEDYQLLSLYSLYVFSHRRF